MVNGNKSVWGVSLLAIFSTSAGAAVIVPRKSDCCALLHSQHPGHVFFPNSTGYQLEASDTYWSGTAHLKPTCVFTPTTAEIVSEAVKVFGRNNCSFAIRSGGHSTAEGWANIDGGVLLATTNLSSITLGNDHMSVGPGLRWGAVYNFLDPHALVVVGGRGAEVGVAGLVLGGGISSFTPERGLACDNIKGIQIVIAGGHIIEASAESNSDLWQALKGSQNMFGVVTRLDLYTFSSPQLHSFEASIDMSSFAQVAAVYDDYINSRSGGEDTEHLAVGLVQVQQLPGAFSRFPELPLSGLTESRGTMATFAAGTPTPKLRYDLRTLSFHSSVEMLKRMKQIFEEEIVPVQVADPSFSGIIEWQLITEHAIRQGIERGGNMLGLDSGSGPLIIFAMANSWADISGDEAAHAAAQRVVERGEALARKLGVYNRFLYANYAADGQDVLASYGEKNVARLRQVRRKYDCNNALSTLIPGGLSGM